MKKILLLIVCLFMVTGCGNKKEDNVDVTLNMDKIKTNLSSLKISDSNPYSNMDSVNDLDLIEGYGIDVSLLDEYVIYISSSVEDPSMYMVLNIKEGNESVVKYQINDMFDKYLSAYKGYYPEAAGIIEDKMEKEYSDYLIYIISNDNQKVYNKILECKE